MFGLACIYIHLATRAPTDIALDTEAFHGVATTGMTADHLAVPSDSSLATIEDNALVSRAVGWEWWNKAQFGAWVALGTALFGVATQVKNDVGKGLSIAGGVICYGIAIMGGAAVTSKRDLGNGDMEVTIKLTKDKSATYLLTPIQIVASNGSLLAKRSDAVQQWYYLHDDEPQVVSLFGFDADRNTHAIAGWGEGVNKTDVRMHKRSARYDFKSWDDGPARTDYMYSHIEYGNSAREYYFDHSKSDWEYFMQHMGADLMQRGNDRIQPACLVPQDSQGNAVAAIMVEFNNAENESARNHEYNCGNEALKANPTFQPNRKRAIRA